MTFPMTFAYMVAYAAVRSCLGALADISDLLGVSLLGCRRLGVDETRSQGR